MTFSDALSAIAKGAILVFKVDDGTNYYAYFYVAESTDSFIHIFNVLAGEGGLQFFGLAWSSEGWGSWPAEEPTPGGE